MPPILVFFIIVIVGLSAFFVFRRSRLRQGVWLQFFSRGKEAGFTFREIELLRRLAVKSSLGDPASLFWSQNQLDICIRAMVRNLRLSGEDQDQNTQDFLSKLYDFRKKIEVEKPRAQSGIASSRQMNNAQPVRIHLRYAGVFRARVMGNTDQYLVISRPENEKIPFKLPWTGQRVSVYFWREDDAGYVFDTDVLEEVSGKGATSLRLAHSDSLFRTQKRKSVRVKIHKQAFLYPLSAAAGPGKLESSPGLKCFIEDLSDSGCAVTIGGKAETGIRVKLQFALDNVPVIMGGTVRSVDYKGDAANCSLLHVEADPLSLEARNRILGEVFGVGSEEDEDLPFRILDEEAEIINHQSNSHDSA